MDAKLQQRKTNLESKGLLVQLLIVVVGDKQIEESYALIKGISNLYDSPLTAAGTVFKSFYALQLQYPRVTVPLDGYSIQNQRRDRF